MFVYCVYKSSVDELINGIYPEIHKGIMFVIHKDKNSVDLTVYKHTKNIVIYFHKYEAYKMFSIEFMKLNDVSVLCTRSFL